MTADTETIYTNVLTLYYHSVQSLRGHQFSVDQFDFWNGLTGKIIAHAASILFLSKGTRLVDLSFDINFGDSVSVVVLARATMEAYATLHYLFLDATISDDERIFRFTYDQMRGLLVRQAVDTPDIQAQRQQERALIDRLYQVIENTQVFRSLQSSNPNAVRQIRRGRYQHISNTEMIVRAGFSRRNVRFIYAYLSDYTHSGYLSSLQFGQANTAAMQRDHMEIGMRMIAITLALTVQSLAATFPTVQALINSRSEDQILINALCTMAADDSLFTR